MNSQPVSRPGRLDAPDRVRLTMHVERYALADANRALASLRDGRVRGAAVLSI
jgi:hypothetical protein